MPKNESIKCEVKSCRHNYDIEDYCSLQAIKVGTHEPDPKKSQCTDCRSFQIK